LDQAHALIKAEIEKALLDALRQRKCRVVEKSSCGEETKVTEVTALEEVCNVVPREVCSEPFEQCEEECSKTYSCRVCP
jgi:hypothetical protein